MTKKTGGLDLADFVAADDSAVMTLFNPETDEPFVDPEMGEFTITLYGVDSQHYRNVSHSQQNRRIQKAQRTGRAAMTAEQLEAASIELLAKCTKAWNIRINGEVPDCTEAKARDLYQSAPWIREQVDTFVHNRRNFMKR